MRRNGQIHEVVVIGGGFGGLNAARTLVGAPVRVTLIDRSNYHLFQPLLYQVATGGLSPGDIASSFREVLGRHRNVRILMAEVVDVDVVRRLVKLHHGAEVSYDTLVVAAGANQHYFGNDHWQRFAPGLKTIDDALEIRRRFLLAFETAELEEDIAKRRAWLTFLVVGGGPTGVELAGTLGEIAHHTLKRDFRRIDPGQARILLVEGLDRLLGDYPASLSEWAERHLRRLGVEVKLNTLVTGVLPDRVTLRSGGTGEVVPTRTVLWAAGVQASPLGRRLVTESAAQLDKTGRIRVHPDLSLPGHPEVFVIGDLANYPHQTGQPLPGLAPVAMQQGRYVGKLVRRRLEGRSLPSFRYADKGSLATIGRAAAVGSFGRLRFTGFFAWLAWLFVHLMYLVGFENRLLVFIQWAWNYFTWNRGARLITGRALPLSEEASDD